MINLLITNPCVKIFAIIFLISYGMRINTNISQTAKNLFTNPAIRLFILAIMICNGKQNPDISIIIGIIYILSMNKISELELKEGFEQIEQYQNLDLTEL